jgi:acetyltransferase-like isoleucine patch superfamily enzyme
MRYAGLTPFGRLATSLAAIFAKPHKARIYLSRMYPAGYISAKADIFHTDLRLGSHIFIDDHVHLFQRKGGGHLSVGDRVCLFKYNIIETGFGGSFEIEADASMHPKCQINAYVSNIHIGAGTMLAPNCALYAYDHSTALNAPIRKQALVSRGDITIGEDAWLGYGCIVLSGVTIGSGAVVGAGSVVTRDIPENAIAVGNPAKIVGSRSI